MDKRRKDRMIEEMRDNITFSLRLACPDIKKDRFTAFISEEHRTRNYISAMMVFFEHYSLFCTYVDRYSHENAFRDFFKEEEGVLKYCNTARADSFRRRAFDKSNSSDEFFINVIPKQINHIYGLTKSFYSATKTSTLSFFTNADSDRVTVLMTREFVQNMYDLPCVENIEHLLSEMIEITRLYFCRDDSVTSRHTDFAELQRSITMKYRDQKGGQIVESEFYLIYAIYPDYIQRKNSKRLSNSDFNLRLVIDFRGISTSKNSSNHYFYYPGCNTSEKKLSESLQKKHRIYYKLQVPPKPPQNNNKRIVAHHPIFCLDQKTGAVKNQMSELLKSLKLDEKIGNKRFKLINNIDTQREVRIDAIEGVHPSIPLLEQDLIITDCFEGYMFCYEKYISKAVQYGDLLSSSKHVYKMIQSSSTNQNLKALSKMKECPEKFNKQQQEIIFGTRNNLTIGRSGTGKTESLLMEILSREVLAKGYRKAVESKKKEKLGVKDLQKESGLSTIYIAASGFLADEVRAKYKLMVKEYLDLYEKQGENKIPEFESEEDILKSMGARNDRTDSLPTSFSKSSEPNYPAFMTFREFLYILDKTLHEFRTNSEAQKKENEDDMEVETPFETTIRSIIDKTESIYTPDQKSELYHQDIKAMTHRREVTYDVFKNEFWDLKIKRNNNFKFKLSSKEFWSRAMSFYKGNPKTYASYGSLYDRIFSATIFRRLKSDEISNINITADQTKEIESFFDIFEKYEHWKSEHKMFDLEDLVGSLFNESSSLGAFPVMFHFILIDEIQDLSLNALDLVNNLCSSRYILCGDNAQNIDRGLSIKFNDIKKFLQTKLSEREKVVYFEDFYNIEESYTTLHIDRLTINYRSTHPILQLGNIMIALLETFFPDEIDALPKETGPRPGVMPKFIAYQEKSDILFDIYVQRFKCEVKNVDGVQKIVPRSNFCVLVRNKEDKDTIPEYMKDLIVLTLKECKGLEFEHVLLYNFFSSSPAKKGWRSILKTLELEEVKSDGPDKQQDSDLGSFEVKKDKEILKYIFKLQNKNLGQGVLTDLSQELKLLYVAITRAKQGFMIFDEPTDSHKSTPRIPLDKLFSDSETIVVITRQNYLDEGTLFYEQSYIPEAEKKSLREKGLHLLREGYHELAVKFFNASNDYKLARYSKSMAFVKEVEEAINKLCVAVQNGAKVTKKDIASVIENSNQRLEEIATNFEELACFGEAAECYAALGKTDKAIEFYTKAGMIKKVRDLQMAHGEFGSALKNISFEEDPVGAIECLFKCNKPILGPIESHNIDLHSLSHEIIEKYLDEVVSAIEEDFMIQDDVDETEKDEIVEDDSLSASEFKRILLSSSEDDWEVISDQLSEVASFDVIKSNISSLRSVSEIELIGLDLKIDKLKNIILAMGNEDPTLLDLLQISLRLNHLDYSLALVRSYPEDFSKETEWAVISSMLSNFSENRIMGAISSFECISQFKDFEEFHRKCYLEIIKTGPFLTLHLDQNWTFEFLGSKSPNINFSDPQPITQEEIDKLINLARIQDNGADVARILIRLSNSMRNGYELELTQGIASTLKKLINPLDYANSFQSRGNFVEDLRQGLGFRYIGGEYNELILTSGIVFASKSLAENLFEESSVCIASLAFTKDWVIVKISPFYKNLKRLVFSPIIDSIEKYESRSALSKKSIYALGLGFTHLKEKTHAKLSASYSQTPGDSAPKLAEALFLSCVSADDPLEALIAENERLQGVANDLQLNEVFNTLLEIEFNLQHGNLKRSSELLLILTPESWTAPSMIIRAALIIILSTEKNEKLVPQSILNYLSKVRWLKKCEEGILRMSLPLDGTKATAIQIDQLRILMASVDLKLLQLHQMTEQELIDWINLSTDKPLQSLERILVPVVEEEFIGISFEHFNPEMKMQKNLVIQTSLKTILNDLVFTFISQLSINPSQHVGFYKLINLSLQILNGEVECTKEVFNVIKKEHQLMKASLSNIKNKAQRSITKKKVYHLLAKQLKAITNIAK